MKPIKPGSPPTGPVAASRFRRSSPARPASPGVLGIRDSNRDCGPPGFSGIRPVGSTVLTPRKPAGPESAGRSDRRPRPGFPGLPRRWWSLSALGRAARLDRSYRLEMCFPRSNDPAPPVAGFSPSSPKRTPQPKPVAASAGTPVLLRHQRSASRNCSRKLSQRLQSARLRRWTRIRTRAARATSRAR